MEFWFLLILTNAIMMYLFFHIRVYIFLQYKRMDSNDYIAVKVYTIKKTILYSMEIPMIKMAGTKELFWIQSKIKTAQSQDTTHNEREQRFVRKNLKYYLLHPRKLRYIAKLFRHYARLYCDVMEEIAKKLHCEQLYWKTNYGSEDAAITGTITGMLWSIKSLLITRLKKKIIFNRQPIIMVTPTFGEEHLNIDFTCIFSIRIGNVINAMRSLHNIK